MTQWQDIDHLLLQFNDQVELFQKQKVREELVFFINYLLLNDFNRLVNVLYRVDVNESKLKHLLKENQGFDAVNIITDLIIERELQKIRSRQEYRNDENISDDEKW